jgi:DNA mismatch repair ATPase MutS
MLTTHYLTVCENMKSYKNIINKHMKLENDNSTFILENGISYEKSGIKILKQLNYPNEIIESANLISNNYKI